jgi:AcrR family transcriptional regulator
MPLDVRRAQMLDVGIELFAKRSWEEVSIEEIASACGVSRGLLYHYFRGKRDYYIASIEYAVERLNAAYPDPGLPATTQLLVGLGRFFTTIAQHPETYAALRRVPAADEEAAAILERDRQEFAERVLAGIPKPGSGSPLARATVRAWIGSVEASGLYWLRNPGVPAEQLVAVLSEALIAAMLAAARFDPSIELPASVQEALSSRTLGEVLTP